VKTAEPDPVQTGNRVEISPGVFAVGLENLDEADRTEAKVYISRMYKGSADKKEAKVKDNKSKIIVEVSKEDGEIRYGVTYEYDASELFAFWELKETSEIDNVNKLKEDLEKEFERKLKNAPEDKHEYYRNLANKIGVDEAILHLAEIEARVREHKEIINDKDFFRLSKEEQEQRINDHKKESLKQVNRFTRMEQLMLYDQPQKSIIPNLAAKTDYFLPQSSAERLFTKKWSPLQVWNLQDVTAQYRFFRPDQIDLNGWMMLIRYAKRDSEFYAAFTGHEFLKAMRKGTSSRDYDWLKGFIDCMTGSQVQITAPGKVNGIDKTYRYSEALAPRLIEEVTHDRYVLQLSRTLWQFLGVDDFSLVKMDQRFQLGNNQYALAVHAYMLANKSPLWFKISQLKDKWGGNYGTLQTFWKNFKSRAIKPLMKQGIITSIEEKRAKELGDTVIGIFYDVNS